jgi:predicted GNAT family acetyltransferase
MPDARSGPEEQVVDDPGAGQFALTVGGEVAAVILYDRQPDAYALMHTETRAGFEHRGMATRLIQATLDRMVESGAAVLPYCPFVRRFIAQHREYATLVPAADRARFGLD